MKMWRCQSEFWQGLRKGVKIPLSYIQCELILLSHGSVFVGGAMGGGGPAQPAHWRIVVSPLVRSSHHFSIKFFKLVQVGLVGTYQQKIKKQLATSTGHIKQKTALNQVEIGGCKYRSLRFQQVMTAGREVLALREPKRFAARSMRFVLNCCGYVCENRWLDGSGLKNINK